MENLNFKVATPTKAWSKEEPFIDDKLSVTTTEMKNEPSNNNLIDVVLKKAKATKDMIVDESKVIAPDVVDTFKESKTRLNQENRVIKAIPNSYLYYGIVGVGLWLIVKKFA